MKKVKVVWVMWPDELWQLKGYRNYFESDQRFDFKLIPWVVDEKLDLEKVFEVCKEADVAILFFLPIAYIDQQAIKFCIGLRENGVKIISNDFLCDIRLADFDYLRSLCALPRVLAEKLQCLVVS